MRNRAVVLIGLMAVAMAAHPAGAAELGDPAPQLQVTEWVRGGPINLAAGKGKNIYVIEFWATWCLPCRESIPHLTEIQKKYRDRGVIVAGIAAEDAADVKRYVANMGERMAYAVGVDDGDKTSIA
ncbi:MAG: TlpA family protein disulfide reductase, partial [Candidatus Hydrogenedentes bacterium]|nr:TlpA family protein disulfide reductase [Candidatus Hydrogenedentota bacterium]